MKRRKQPYQIVWLSCVLLSSLVETFAHPISQSSVTADVYSNRVDVTIEVKLEDLAWFQNLKTNATDKLDPAEVRKSASKHQQFLVDYFHIIDSHGNPYAGTPSGIDLGTHVEFSPADLATASIGYRYEYQLPERFGSAPSKHLTIWQNFGGLEAPVPSIMELQVKHRGAWLGRSVNLPSGIPHISRIDRGDSGTPPRSLAEIRERKARAKMVRLGLTSYGGVYSFVYRQPNSISHQLLIPYEKLKLLWPGNWPTNEVIDPEVIKRIEQTIATELPKYHHAVSAGRRIAPRIHPPRLVAVDQIEIEQEFRPSTIHAKLARIALTAEFSGLATNQAVELHWNAFDKTVPFLKSMIFDHDYRSPRLAFFTAQKVTHAIEWPIEQSNPFEACARRLAAERLKHLFPVYGRNSFMAGWRFAGTPLVAMERACDVVDRVSFRFSSLQSVANLHALTGKLSVTWSEIHWGHVHQRTDEFDARLLVQSVGGAWVFSWKLESASRVRLKDTRIVSGVKISTIVR